jgi:hypothetical protein
LTTTPDVLPRETATDERCGNSRRGWVGLLGWGSPFYINNFSASPLEILVFSSFLNCFILFYLGIATDEYGKS